VISLSPISYKHNLIVHSVSRLGEKTNARIREKEMSYFERGGVRSRGAPAGTQYPPSGGGGNYAPVAQQQQQPAIGAPLVGDPINGRGWGTPVWAWALIFLFTLLTLALAIWILVWVGQTHESKNSKECRDGNRCTIDYKINGGCESRNRPNGDECENVCYESGDQSTCQAGECTGEGCIGTCVLPGDCPLIPESVINPGFEGPICRFGRCMTAVTEAVTFAYSSMCEDSFVEQECMLLVDPAYALKECLTVDAFCSIDADKKREIEFLALPEEEQAKVQVNKLHVNGTTVPVRRDIDTITRGCIFRFSCAPAAIVGP